MKLIPISLAVVVVCLVGCSEPSPQYQLQSRMEMSGAVNKAVRAYQAKEKKWPATLDELVAGGYLKDLSPERLKKVTYSLVKSDKKEATYALTIEGKTRETKVPAWMPTQGTPTLGQATSSGG